MALTFVKFKRTFYWDLLEKIHDSVFWFCCLDLKKSFSRKCFNGTSFQNTCCLFRFSPPTLKKVYQAIKLDRLENSFNASQLIIISVRCTKGIFSRRSQSDDTLIFNKLNFYQQLSFRIFKKM